MITATTGEGCYDQGRFTIRPPLFRGTNFSYWQNLLQIFIKTEDHELQNIVTRGPYAPMTTIDGKSQSKTKEQYTQEDFVKLFKNFKAMNILYCGPDANEYNSICSYETTKQIWDKLV